MPCLLFLSLACQKGLLIVVSWNSSLEMGSLVNSDPRGGGFQYYVYKIDKVHRRQRVGRVTLSSH